ncbi:MAG TPA: hypothetical protein VGF31_12280, partial [Myxococcaceae bacterium]
MAGELAGIVQGTGSSEGDGSGGSPPAPPCDGSGTTTWVSRVGVPRGAAAGGCNGGAGEGVPRAGELAGGSGTGPPLRGASGRGPGTGDGEKSGRMGGGVDSGGRGMAPVVAGRSVPGTGLVAPGAIAGGRGMTPGVRETTVGSWKNPGGGPGTGLCTPGSGGSGMAPVVGDEAAAAGETSSGL